MLFSTVIVSVSIALVIFSISAIVISQIKKSKKSSKRSRASILNEASKKLAQNPHDVKGLRMMGDIHYKDKDWEKAYSVYVVLNDHLAALPPSQQFELNLRFGISALKTNRLNEAIGGFILARNIDPHSFDVNYNLGYIHYIQRNYEKAIPLFRQSLVMEENHFLAIKYLGYSYQKIRKHNDALPFLKKAFDVNPDDKEILYAMGESFFELGNTDKSLKILTHLRADPALGPRSCLYCGLIRIKQNQLEKAIEDFEIGLRHKNIPIEIANELRYRLAQSNLKTQDIGKALVLLKEIQSVNPNYKDVSSLILRYQELNHNKNLKTYLMSGQSEFVGLCRKIVTRFYPKAKVKIVDITVLTTHTDIVADIDTSRYSDTVLFRFFRSQGTVGELLLRDFHGRVKEQKAGSGVCMTAGTFTEESLRFGEGRPIDLYDKNRLNKVLDSLD